MILHIILPPKAILLILFLVMPIMTEAQESWAQKTLDQMSIDEKIGQLFMIAGYVDSAYAANEINHLDIIQEIDGYIRQYHIGGIAFVGPSECLKQVALTNHYQAISRYPLLIAQDLEWGLAMRIKDGMRFPKNSTLAVLKNNDLIYEMGKEIGRQAQLIGVHMNLSPVLDVNTESENVAINVRSFGNSPTNVAEKGIAMIQGLQSAGIIASAKHFPGLGDISVDPHLGLPYSKHNKMRLNEVELYPFTKAITAGVLSIQTEHLVVPALEPEPNLPASLSPAIVTGILKEKLGFSGLILSGALRMKALTNNFSDEEIALKAFLAGSDMLLMPRDLPKAVQTLQVALKEGKISESDIDKRLIKILQLKEKLQLDKQKIIPLPTMEQLHTTNARELKKRLYQNTVSVLRNYNQLIPLCVNEAVAYIQLGDAPTSDFFDSLNKKVTLSSFPLIQDHALIKENLLPLLNHYSTIIVAVYPADPRRIEQIRLLSKEMQEDSLKQFKVHGIPDTILRLVDILQPLHKKIIVIFFGNSFGLHFFDNYSTLIMAHEPDPDAQRAAAALLIP